MKKKILFLASILFPTISFAQSLGAKEFIAFPIISASPDTGIVGGGFLIHNLWDAGDRRFSQLRYVATYSEKDQKVFAFSPEFFFFGQFLIVNFGLLYKDFPSFYFGIGNKTPASNKESFTEEQFAVGGSLAFNFFSRFYLRYEYSIDDRKIAELSDGGLLQSDLVNGDQDSRLYGGAYELLWDSRDNPQYPTNGLYFEYSFKEYRVKYRSPEASESTYYYIRHRIDLRKYFPLGETQSIAAQVFLEKLNGNRIPILRLVGIGGANLLRGFYDKRFRDKSVAAVQVSYRLLLGRVGFEVFSGLGKVSENLDLVPDHLHHAFGGGITLILDSQSKTNIHADLGHGEGETNFYVSINQAF